MPMCIAKLTNFRFQKLWFFKQITVLYLKRFLDYWIQKVPNEMCNISKRSDLVQNLLVANFHSGHFLAIVGFSILYLKALRYIYIFCFNQMVGISSVLTRLMARSKW